MLQLLSLALLTLDRCKTARARRQHGNIEISRDDMSNDTVGWISASREYSIWAPTTFMILSDATIEPIDVESNATIIVGEELRTPQCLHMSFDEAVATVNGAESMISEFKEVYTKLAVTMAEVNTATHKCPECTNFIAATGNMLQVQHAWAIMSVVVNLIDILSMSNPSFHRVTHKLWDMTLDYYANDHFFDRKACSEVFQVKCLLSLIVAYLNRAGKKYFHGMVAVMASVVSEMVMAAKDMWSIGVNGASLWKLFFSLSRLIVFVLVGLLGGAPTGQFADALVQLGHLAIKSSAENVMTSLHETFRGLELDYMSDSMYDSTLGTECADKLAQLIYDDPGNLIPPTIQEKLIHEIEFLEDRLPFDKWDAAARLDGARVFNAYLQRPSLHEESNQEMENWEWVRPRYEELAKEDPRVTSPPQAHAMWACRMGERICVNRRKPEETQVVNAISGDITSVEIAVDIDRGWKVPMPWFHSCCITSKSCS